MDRLKASAARVWLRAAALYNFIATVIMIFVVVIADAPDEELARRRPYLVLNAIGGTSCPLMVVVPVCGCMLAAAQSLKQDRTAWVSVAATLALIVSILSLLGIGSCGLVSFDSLTFERKVRMVFVPTLLLAMAVFINAIAAHKAANAGGRFQE